MDLKQYGFKSMFQAGRLVVFRLLLMGVTLASACGLPRPIVRDRVGVG